MQEENIDFEEIGKDSTPNVGQSSSPFKQPIHSNWPNLYAELKARCAPENYMDPYEPDKVTRANELYSRVLSLDKKDVSSMKALRLQAMEELGVKFSTEQLYNRLIDACNPRNYTGVAYNKDRLDLANQLYPSVQKNADDIIELEKIEVKAKELIEDYNKENKETGSNIDLLTFILVFVCFLFYIIIVIALCLQTLGTR